jgi:DNA polymerase-3 subunit gamma/tau
VPSSGGPTAVALQSDPAPSESAGGSEATRPPAAAVELATAQDIDPQVSGAPATVTRDLESVCSLWPAVVDLVRGENALLGALIAEAQPVEIDGEDLTVAFASSKPFLRKKASVPLNRAAVTEALRAVTGVRWRLAFELRDTLGSSEQESPEPVRSEEEWVARFMEEFDAEEVPGEWDHAHGTDAQGEELEAATSEEKGH